MDKNQNIKEILLAIIFSIVSSIILILLVETNIAFSAIFILFSILDLLLLMKQNKDVKNIILFTYILRVLMAVIYCFYGDADPDGYGLTAITYTSMNLKDYFLSMPLNAYFYSWCIGGIWKITGVDYVVIRLINAFLSFISCIIAYKLTKMMTNEKTAKKVLMFCCIFPTLIRFSSPFSSRETLFVFFTISFFYNVYLQYSTRKKGPLIKSIIYLLLAIIIHTGALTYIMIYGYLYILGNLKYKRKLFSNIFAFFTILLLIMVIFRNGIGTSKLSMGGNNMELMERVNYVQSSASSGRAAYLQGLHTSNPVLTLVFMPIRAIYFTFAPFIWMCRTIMDLFGLLDSTLYLLICYQIFKNRKFLSQNKYIMGLFLSILAFICLMGLSVSNYGTALRHRQKIVIPLLVICEVSLFYKNKAGEKK